jgi:hypothetical protein
MKPTSKLVSIQRSLGSNFSFAVPELDALELEAEEEGPSYLSNINTVPDFVDEAPVEEVRFAGHFKFRELTAIRQAVRRPEAIKATV